MERQPSVYILSNQCNGTLYVGVTSNLPNRIWQHKNRVINGFSHTYKLDNLVWYELHETMESAICREMAIIKWNRGWEIELSEEFSPEWRDLYKEIL